MSAEKLPGLDPIIHSRVRLAILSILISSKEAEFTFLKETIGATDGNLSVHLSKLEQAGFVKIKKSFAGKRPLTTISITEVGKKAFSNYLNALEKILHPDKNAD
ncbi:MAG: transcriptional regulator [Calditrichaeota bacterium]|nr:transcriptional regulator [Calditrichota bacterium]